MKTNIKIAVRNVHKNIKNLWLNGVGITLTTIAIILINSLSRGIEEQIVKRNIQFETGAVTIQINKELAGYQNQAIGESIYKNILHCLKNEPSITNIRPRIITHNALLYTNEGTHKIKIVGLQNQELPLLNKMQEITNGNTNWQQITNGILISKGLAEEANLTIGDNHIIALQSADGTVNIQEFIITGIFLNNSQQSKNTIYTPYQQARSLYYTNLPSHLLIDLTDLRYAGEIKENLIQLTNNKSIEISAYTDNLSRAKALSGINKSFMLGMTVFLLTISFVGIWAMQTENINERRKEIGTLLTFGFSRKEVKHIFLTESVYISALFLMAGLITAITLIVTTNLLNGINLGESASFAFGSSVINPLLRATDILQTSIIIFVYPLLATWISLQTLNKTQAITLLNKKY